MSLARTHPAYGGIILTQQQEWTLSSLIAAVDNMLANTEAEEWPGHVRWLNDWRIDG